jgi:hypothetical protein
LWRGYSLVFDGVNARSHAGSSFFVAGLTGRRTRLILSFSLSKKKGTIAASFFFSKFFGGEVE